MENLNQTASEKIEPLNEDGKLFAALTYPFGLLIAIILYLAKKDDKFVRFHAKQAIMLDIISMVFAVVMYIVIIIVFLVFFILGLVGAVSKSPIGALFSIGGTWIGMALFYGFIFLYAIATIAIRLFLAYKAYKGNAYMLPIIGKEAAK